MRVRLGAVILMFLMAACSKQDAVNVKVTTAPATSTLSGTFAYQNAGISALASACVNPVAALYKIETSGDVASTATATTPINSTGNYSFKLSNLNIRPSGSTLPGAYIVSVQGCGNGVYLRPVTGLKNQNINAGSTVVGYLINTYSKSQFAEALTKNPAKVATIFDALSSQATTADAYAQLSSTTSLADTFNTLFSTPPTALSEAHPQVLNVSWPSTASELVGIPLSVTQSHWSSSYSMAIEWKLDGTVISTQENPTFTPSGNLQGTHTLTVTVGENDGTGHIDTTKPVIAKTNTIVIQNNVLPTAPSFTLQAPAVSGSNPVPSRSLTLRIATGAALANCDTFTSLAFTESNTAPTDPAAFTRTCQTNTSQDEAYTLTSPGDGAKSIYAWVIDASGTVSTTPTQISFNLDTNVPTTTLTSVPAPLNNLTSFNFAFTATDSGGTISSSECKLDSAAWAPCSSPHAVNSLAEGDHTFAVRSYDSAGNVSSDATTSWHTDLTVPVLSLTAAPPAVTNSVSASFSFSATDSGGATVAGYLCSVDGSSYLSCTSPQMATYAAGSHVFNVKATDTAGNVSATSSHTWLVDTSAPVVTLTSTPASLTNSPTANFAFSATDTGSGSISGYQCKLDSGAFASCTSPASYSSLAAGAHSFVVKATDGAGNVGTSTTFNWTIDLTTPMTSITSQPSSPTNVTSASFVFSATAPPDGSITGYECRVDAGSFAACTSPASVNSLTQGTHTFAVRSKDNNGNYATPTTVSWIVDLTPPVTTITAQPPNPSNSASASFTFSATDSGGATVASFQCSRDAGAFSACASPTAYSSLTEGTHTVVIRALDTAGNVSANASVTWTVDLTAPVLTLTSSPAVITNATSASFSFSATDTVGVASYSCSLDGQIYAACTSPAAVSGLAQGAHTFAIKVTDTAGNVSTATTHAWTVDLTAPTVSISAGPASGTNVTTASFTFSGTDTGGGSISSYLCEIDGGGYSGCTSVKSYTGLAASAHTFHLKAVDTAGNTSSVATHTWTVDLTSPVVTITTPSSNGQVMSAASLSAYPLAGACNENGLSVSISGAASATATCSSNAWSTTVNVSALSDGTLSFTASQTDAAGNTGSSAARTAIKDTVAPAITVNTPSSLKGGATSGASFTLTELNVGTSTSFNVEIFNGATWSSIGTVAATSGSNSAAVYNLASYTVPTIDVSTAKIRVTLTDAAGNSGNASSSAFIIDSTAPALSITSAPPSITNATTASIVFSATDAGSGGVTYQCKLDSGTFASCTSPKALTGLAAGAHTYYVRATDAVGNTSADSTATWTIDTTAPVVTITTPSTNGTTVATSGLSAFTLSGACNENGLTVTIAGSLSATTTCSSGAWSKVVDLSALSNGTLSVTAAQTDAAGNTGTSAARTFIKDTTAPTVTLTQPVALPGNTNQTLTYTAADNNALAATPIKFESSVDDGVTWTTVIAATANTSSYVWSVPAATNTLQAKLRITVTDLAGNTVTQTSNVFVIDSVFPTVSAMAVNGSTSVTSNNVPMNLAAGDNYKLTHFCFLYNTTTQPALNDSCWVPVASAGGVPGTSLNFTNYFTRIGFTAGTYTLRGWVRDEAGNVSTMTSTSGTDLATATLSPPAPPTMTSVLAVSNTSPSSPPATSDLTLPAGSSVYLYWQASDPSGSLPATAIDLAYTVDDNTWTPFATGLPNAAGTGCTLFGSYTGCYVWTNGSPTSSYYKVRAKVTNAANYSAINVSLSLNVGIINFLLGNTNVGTDASATSGVFVPVIEGDPRRGPMQSLAVHPNGTIFFRDSSRGIVKVDPTTGIASVFLRQSGTTSGDGVNVLSATASTISAITFDQNNNLLVYDNNRIRRINLSLATPTISTIIGGGSDTSATVSDAKLASITGVSANNGHIFGLFVIPATGDIIFRQTSNAPQKLRWYHASDGSLTTVAFTGSGIFPAPGNTLDASICGTESQVLPVLDASGELDSFISHILTSPTTGGSPCSYDTNYNSRTARYSTSGAFLNAFTAQSTYVLGRNGEIYSYTKSNGTLAKLDKTNWTWSTVAGVGAGNCVDGTTFATCPTNFDDVFVDLSGKFYFSDQGAIRTIDDSSQLLTIAGQKLNYGDGLSPLQARFGKLSSFNLWNDGTSDRIVTLDTQMHYIRETSLGSGGTTTTLAGNGISGSQSTSVVATASVLSSVISNSTANNIAVAPTGEVFLGGPQRLDKLSRTDGKWSTIAGGGSTYFYDAADGALGTSVKFANQNNMIYVLGYGNGNVLFAATHYTNSKMTRNSFELVNAAASTITPLTKSSSVNAGSSSFGADNSSLNDVVVPVNEQLGMDYDAQTGGYFASINNSSYKRIYRMIPGGTLEPYVTTSSNVGAFAYRRVNATTENFFVCTGTSLVKYTVTNGSSVSSTALPWPISSMSCTGNSLKYSATRNGGVGSLLFAYKQNGLYGVAEYLNP